VCWLQCFRHCLHLAPDLVVRDSSGCISWPAFLCVSYKYNICRFYINMLISTHFGVIYPSLFVYEHILGDPGRLREGQNRGGGGTTFPFSLNVCSGYLLEKDMVIIQLKSEPCFCGVLIGQWINLNRLSERRRDGPEYIIFVSVWYLEAFSKVNKQVFNQKPKLKNWLLDILSVRKWILSYRHWMASILKSLCFCGFNGLIQAFCLVRAAYLQLPYEWIVICRRQTEEIIYSLRR
jgi:hypothetical protein